MTDIYIIPKWLPSQNSRVQNANFCLTNFNSVILRCTANFHFTNSWWSSLERKKMEWEMGKDTRKMNNIMRAEVQKCIEFSLPQAQVLYISSRNKFILVKTTNLSLSSFMPSCTPISSATIIPISSWSGLTTKTTTPGPNFHMATRHVEDGSKLCLRAFWRSLRW